MRQRRETIEHPFGTIKARMGATHFLMKTLPRVASEMALHVLAYNLTRVMNIMGVTHSRHAPPKGTWVLKSVMHPDTGFNIHPIILFQTDADRRQRTSDFYITRIRECHPRPL